MEKEYEGLTDIVNDTGIFGNSWMSKLGNYKFVGGLTALTMSLTAYLGNEILESDTYTGAGFTFGTLCLANLLGIFATYMLYLDK